MEITTSGKEPTKGFSNDYITIKSVARCKVVDVVAGVIGTNQTPFIQVTVMSLEENAEKPTDYGPGKTSKTSRYWFTEGAIGSTLSKFANYRDALRVDIDSIKVSGDLGITLATQYATQLKPVIVGKTGYFLIGGQRSHKDASKVYSQVYDWDFVAPDTQEGKKYLEGKLLELGDKLITGDTPATEGASTSSPTITPTNFSGGL